MLTIFLNSTLFPTFLINLSSFSLSSYLNKFFFNKFIFLLSSRPNNGANSMYQLTRKEIILNKKENTRKLGICYLRSRFYRRITENFEVNRRRACSSSPRRFWIAIRGKNLIVGGRKNRGKRGRGGETVERTAWWSNKRVADGTSSNDQANGTRKENVNRV